MNWNAVLMAGLLIASSAVVANNETSASGSDDEPGTTASDPSYEEFGLAGWFIRDYNVSHKEDLKALIAQYEGRGPHYDTSGEHLQFGVDALSEPGCKELNRILSERDYVIEMADCRLTRDADGSYPHDEPTDDKPTGTETHDEKPSETETATKDDTHTETGDEADKDDEYSADPNRHPEAARCEQKTGEDKYRCFNEYCKNPHEDHAEPCEKFQDNWEDEQERREAQTKFSTCREGATTASQRQKCASDYADNVGNDDDRWERESRISEAKMAGKVGARVNIDKDGYSASDAATGGGYDVSVQVQTMNAKARQDDVDFRVTVSADLLEGRTIVLDVDPDVLSGPTLVVRYFDVFDDGSETEVIIRQATDLADVLDATDDGGQPEFWVVQDSNGLQLMASVPHWSVHAITVQGIGEFVSAPSIIAGLVFGVVGSVMAAAVLFKPRKGDDL